MFFFNLYISPGDSQILHPKINFSNTGKRLPSTGSNISVPSSDTSQSPTCPVPYSKFSSLHSTTPVCKEQKSPAQLKCWRVCVVNIDTAMSRNPQPQIHRDGKASPTTGVRPKRMENPSPGIDVEVRAWSVQHSFLLSDIYGLKSAPLQRLLPPRLAKLVILNLFVYHKACLLA